MAASSQPTIDSADAAPAVTEPERPLWVRLLILAVGALALVAAGRWGYTHWVFSRSHVTTDDAQVDGRIVPVLAKVGGYVARVSVAENDHVSRGAVLVQLDDVEYAQRLAQATAEQRGAEATVGSDALMGAAQASVAGATSQRGALDAQIAAARTTLEAARTDLARAEELAGRQIIPRAQLDAARTAATNAQSAVDGLERQASVADAGVASAQAGVRLARAKLDEARSVRDNAALSLSYTTISAPEPGNVSRKQVETGQLVQPGQPLMAIVSDEASWITANFKETQMADVHVGQTVDIAVDAYDGCRATGKVQSVSAATGAKFALIAPDNATGNFTKVVQRVPVRIEITQGCEGERPLRPGMSVTATVRIH